MVPVLRLLLLGVCQVVNVFGDRSWFGAIKVAPLAGGLHGVLEAGLEDGPVCAFRIKMRDVGRQLFNVWSGGCSG